MSKSQENTFALDLDKIRQRARERMKDGALTSANTSEHYPLLEALNDALATEIVCVLRYKAHYYSAQGVHGRMVAKEFLAHAGEEQAHADQIAERIDQLGGKPDLDPSHLVKRAHTEYREGDDLKHMIKENLVAERIAIEIYTEMIRWVGDSDPTTRRMLEEILCKEEEHADDMSKLLLDF